VDIIYKLVENLRGYLFLKVDINELVLYAGSLDILAELVENQNHPQNQNIKDPQQTGIRLLKMVELTYLYYV
jgi:hypothetical protein